jgi:hypothetical protein
MGAEWVVPATGLPRTFAPLPVIEYPLLPVAVEVMTIATV